jgi:hypothetical protein
MRKNSLRLGFTLGQIWDELIHHLFWTLYLLLPNRSRIVPRADDPDTLMLAQIALVKGRLYLQRFLEPEQEDTFHNHRWCYMRSFVLSGFYIEERPGGVFVHRSRFQTHTMDWTTIHRIEGWGQRCVTLFYMSREQRESWGYFPAYALRRAKFTDWRQFIKRRVPSLESGNTEITQ